MVSPRLLALSFMMPLLVLYSDFVGILGGAVVGLKLFGYFVDPVLEPDRRFHGPA